MKSQENIVVKNAKESMFIYGPIRIDFYGKMLLMNKNWNIFAIFSLKELLDHLMKMNVGDGLVDHTMEDMR